MYIRVGERIYWGSLNEELEICFMCFCMLWAMGDPAHLLEDFQGSAGHVHFGGPNGVVFAGMPDICGFAP